MNADRMKDFDTRRDYYTDGQYSADCAPEVRPTPTDYQRLMVLVEAAREDYMAKLARKAS